jgi:tetrahydrodipicolinate N-succinyltransferase
MEGCRIGNFVELKNSTLGPGCKADHLAYVGDADVGARSSFGCGAIVVNYDWNAKHRTKVGEDCTIGCNVNLVAPIVIADRVSVAAGSTLTQDVPEDTLAIARARQRNVEGWRARRDGRARPAAAAKSGESPKARTAPSTAATNKSSPTVSRAKAAPRAAPKKKGGKKSAKKRTARTAKPAKKAARKKSAKRATRHKR